MRQCVLDEAVRQMHGAGLTDKQIALRLGQRAAAIGKIRRRLGLQSNGRNKFGAAKTIVNGIQFDSAKEARRYGELSLLLRAGKIRDLECQPKYELHGAGGEKVGIYKSDFRYWDIEKNEQVVEDVKSKATRTTAYRLRKRLVEAEYGITIREV